MQHNLNVVPRFQLPTVFACMLVQYSYISTNWYSEDNEQTTRFDFMWRCSRFAEITAAKEWLSTAKFDHRPEFASRLFDISMWPARDDRVKFQTSMGMTRYDVSYDEDDDPTGRINYPGKHYIYV
jgi:hypothetical protein